MRTAQRNLKRRFGQVFLMFHGHNDTLGQIVQQILYLVICQVVPVVNVSWILKVDFLTFSFVVWFDYNF